MSTVDLDARERGRLHLQARLDAARPAAERNRLGQFATPPTLARAVAREGLAARGDGPLRFLDPAVGTGAFYAALRAELGGRPLDRAVGVELDEGVHRAAAGLWTGHPVELRRADFTRLTPAPAFDLILCNPPYVRHHHLPPADKARLVAASSRVAGERISALSGLYVHFLLQSLAWMAPGGAGVWLIPSEFMDVNYGRALRRVLLSQVTLIRVHRADPTALAFDDALVSSAVVVLRQGPPPAGHRVHMSFGGSLAAPDRAAWVPVERLAGAPKWTRFPEDADATAAPATAATLGDLFSIKRGVVTGANDFFIVSEADAARLDLPREFLTPILPGPRGVPTDEVLPRGDGLPALDPVLFLVDCGLAPDRVRERAPSLWRYLSGGEGALAGRYLCSRRRPWYAQEQRPPAPILCTYMGRGSSTRRRPFRFLRNRTAAIGANVYLNLYPRVPWSPERLDGLWAWLNALPPEALARVGRVYGGGLYKLEPAELAALPLPSSLVR